jgi:peroxiredoxin
MFDQTAQHQIRAVWMLCIFSVVLQGRLIGQCPKVAMDFNLTAAQGGHFKLHSHLGRAVLLAFVRTQPDVDPNNVSRALVSLLISMDHQYQASGLDVAMIDETSIVRPAGASDNAAGQAIRALLNTSYDWGLTFPLLADPDSRVANAYGVSELPMIVLIDQKGQVWKCWKGQVHPASLAAEIQQVVEGIPAKYPR